MILGALSIKFTFTGFAVYAALGLYLIAFIFLTLRTSARKIGQVAFALGFLTAAIALVSRGISVGRLPMKSMYEVFLTLGMLVYPISLFAKHVLKVGAQFADALLGTVILFPAGFVFSNMPEHLPPALQTPLFLPHVASYMIGYVIIAKSAVSAACVLIFGKKIPIREHGLVPYDIAADRMMRFGLPFMSLGLLLGAIWGQIAFGHYWQWDPKESWSLATWLMIVIYFHLRLILGRRKARLQACTILLTALFMITTLLWSSISSLLESWLGIAKDSYHLYSG